MVPKGITGEQHYSGNKFTQWCVLSAVITARGGKLFIPKVIRPSKRTQTPIHTPTNSQIEANVRTTLLDVIDEQWRGSVNQSRCFTRKKYISSADNIFVAFTEFYSHYGFFWKPTFSCDKLYCALYIVETSSMIAYFYTAPYLNWTL